VTRFGRSYIGTIGVTGAIALAASVYLLVQMPFDNRLAVLAVLTWISGSFAVRVPAVPATIYVSEAFFFTVVLLFGGPPAAVCMAVDGLFISLRRKNREPYRIIFNIAEPTISVLGASTVFYGLYGGAPLAFAPEGAAPALSSLLLPVAAMAAAYFLLNSGFTAVAVASETGQSPYRVWREHFMWLSLNYFGGASVALLLAKNWPSLSLTPPVVLYVVAPLVFISWFTFKTSMDRVEDANHHLTELNKLYLSTVETLAMAIDAKDQITHGHIRRVQNYAVGLAKSIGVADATEIKAIEAAALLHDMGKLAVPEHILNKPGKLTALEYDRIKLHAPIGAQILSAIDFPYPVVPIVRHHHENWDGTGYPDGLRGVDIPLGARIMAVVDCYDALTSDRPYRPALSDQEALEIIEARKGTMYDPIVTDAFMRVHLEIGAEAPVASRDGAPFRELLHTPPLAPVGGPSNTGSSRELSATLLTLADLAGQIGGQTTVEDLAAALGWRLRQTVPCDLLVFYMKDRVSDDLVAVHTVGCGAEAVQGLRLRMGEGLSGWVAVNRTTIVNSSGALDLAARGRLLPARFESSLATPLFANDAVVGVLTLYGAGRDAFNADHQRLAEFAAVQFGPALEQALRFEQDRMASLFDPETGLPNDRYLDRVLASAAYSGRPDGPRPGIVRLGVGTGGADGRDGIDVLLRLAATARLAVRVTDLVFRTGEREVMILMTDNSSEAMASVVHRVTDAMGDAPQDGANSCLEASFALFPDHVATPSDLPRAARARRALMAPARDLATLPPL
jgi:putative nucleotidyltransferase with HDIG domain